MLFLNYLIVLSEHNNYRETSEEDAEFCLHFLAERYGLQPSNIFVSMKSL